MQFINNLVARAKATTTKAAETIDSAAKSINTDRIRWIPVEKITVDPEIKAIFNQNETEIHNISEDMKVNGYNAGNPATVSQDNVLVEGHTRYLAAQRAGLKKIAVVCKQFNSKQEMLEYAYKQQLHRRNLSEQDIFNAYKKLRELTNDDGKKAKTDVQIAEELNVSPRQLAKMKEVERKASPEIMEAFSEGTISLNQAYNQMKEEIKPAEKKAEASKPSTERKSVTETAADGFSDENKISEKTEEADAETTSVDTVEAPAKPKKASSEKPSVERLNLKFRPEDFVLIKNAADAANVSVSEYAMNILMESVRTESLPEPVSQKETA